MLGVAQNGHRGASRSHPAGGGATIPSSRERRFLFYSHDGLGLGHIRRNLALAAAVVEADPEAAVLLATSAEEAEQLGIPERTDVLRLPGLHKVGNGAYTPRRLRLPSGDLGDVRAALLAGAVASFRPSVLVADKHPLGIDGELRPALAALRDVGGRAALGLRDILDEPATVRAEWEARGLGACIAELYDRVLVYGTASVFDPAREYGFPAELGPLVRYCGYVVAPQRARLGATRERPSGLPVVLGTAGGGEDGFRLLEAFVAAASRAAWEAVVVSGRQCSADERKTLRALASAGGVRFRTFVPVLASWFPHVDAVVSMGGYNTLVEAAAAGVPTVCVPRTEPRQEQLIRARLFGRHRLLRLLEPSLLSPAALRAEVSTALETPRANIAERARTVLGLEGARAAATELLELADGAANAPEPVLAVSWR